MKIESPPELAYASPPLPHDSAHARRIWRAALTAPAKLLVLHVFGLQVGFIVVLGLHGLLSEDRSLYLGAVLWVAIVGWLPLREVVYAAIALKRLRRAQAMNLWQAVAGLSLMVVWLASVPAVVWGVVSFVIRL